MILFVFLKIVAEGRDGSGKVFNFFFIEALVCIWWWLLLILNVLEGSVRVGDSFFFLWCKNNGRIVVRHSMQEGSHLLALNVRVLDLTSCVEDLLGFLLAHNNNFSFWNTCLISVLSTLKFGMKVGFEVWFFHFADCRYLTLAFCSVLVLILVWCDQRIVFWN